METSRPRRFEIDSKYFVKTLDGVIIGKTTGAGSHLTILIKDGRLTVHHTILSEVSRKHLYSCNADEREMMEEELDRMFQTLSVKKLPKTIWAIPNEYLALRTKYVSKQKAVYKTPSPKMLYENAIRMDSGTFVNGNYVLGLTTWGTLIMQSKWGSFIVWNMKTQRAIERIFNKNEFFSVLEKARRHL